MPSFNEAGFGNKLAKGQQLIAFIRTLKNYNAPTEHIKIENFAKLLENINETNNQIASSADFLSQARIKRTEYYNGDTGAKKRCAMIRDFVGVLPSGKTSSAFIIIQKEAQKMNNYKKSAKKDEQTAGADLGGKRAISQAETSFGAVLQGLKTVLEVIKNLPTYEPSNELIKIESFEKCIQDIEEANQAVNSQLYLHNELLNKRQELYNGVAGLKQSFQTIKTFVAANYGKQSQEFKEVSKLKY